MIAVFPKIASPLAQRAPMNCPSCSAEIPEGSATCPGCGRARPFPPESQWSASPPASIWVLLGCAALGCLVPLLAAAALATWFLSRA